MSSQEHQSSRGGLRRALACVCVVWLLLSSIKGPATSTSSSGPSGGFLRYDRHCGLRQRKSPDRRDEEETTRRHDAENENNHLPAAAATSRTSTTGAVTTTRSTSKSSSSSSSTRVVVLVTGAAGYIASHFVLLCLTKGLHVVGVDNLSRGSSAAIEKLHAVAATLNLPKDAFVFKEVDLGLPSAVAALFQEPQQAPFAAVFHFAAIAFVGESIAFPDLYRRNVTANTEILGRAAKTAGVPRFVYSSSCSVYGQPANPGEGLDESAAIQPLSPYASSKVEAEKVLQALAAPSFRVNILRYFNVIGADPLQRLGENPRPELRSYGRLWTACVDAARGARPAVKLRVDPKTGDYAKRDFVHVSDLASAHLLAFDKGRQSRGDESAAATRTTSEQEETVLTVHNVGLGKPNSIAEFVESFRAVSGVDVKIETEPLGKEEPLQLFAKSAKIQRDLEWKPRFTDLREMLRTGWAYEVKARGQVVQALAENNKGKSDGATASTKIAPTSATTLSPSSPADTTDSPFPFNRTEFDTLLAAGQARQQKFGYVVVLFFNQGFVKMMKSWICNVKKVVGPNWLADHALFIATERQAGQQLQLFDTGLSIVYVTYKMPAVIRYGQAVYGSFLLWRGKLIRELLQAKLTVWQVEADAYWSRDPSEEVLQQEADIVTMSDMPPPGKYLNGGFLLAKPSEANLKVWSEVIRRMENVVRGKTKDVGEAGNDQLYFPPALKRHGAKVHWLPPNRFACGVWYRNPKIFQKNSTTLPTVILNNWVVGNAKKVERAIKWKHWFLNDEETECLP
ncbi:unnamed protein product [Amoebophrya sp. A120]|nr:unnamed protein product [Amoebophrya sp. A120]|eukprot:GSA120T00020603001.1